MASKRAKRAAAVQAAARFRVPDESEVWRGEESWQQDWHSEAAEERLAPPKRKQAARRGAAGAAEAAAVATAAGTEAAHETVPPQTQQDVVAELEQWLRANRNKNTAATYASAWRQFVRWATEVANPQRAAAAHVDLQHPSEADAALYMRHIVTVKGGTMQSVEVGAGGHRGPLPLHGPQPVQRRVRDADAPRAHADSPRQRDRRRRSAGSC